MDAVALAKQAGKAAFGRVLAVGQLISLRAPLVGENSAEESSSGVDLVLRVTSAHTLDQEAREEAVAYHSYRSGSTKPSNTSPPPPSHPYTDRNQLILAL